MIAQYGESVNKVFILIQNILFLSIYNGTFLSITYIDKFFYDYKENKDIYYKSIAGTKRM